MGTVQNKWLIDNTVERDSAKWDGYVHKPLTFVDSPDSPYYSMLKDDVEAELDYLIDSLESNSICYPSWNWAAYADIWEKVRTELAGMLAADALITLKRFGRLR